MMRMAGMRSKLDKETLNDNNLVVDNSPSGREQQVAKHRDATSKKLSVIQEQSISKSIERTIFEQDESGERNNTTSN